MCSSIHRCSPTVLSPGSNLKRADRTVSPQHDVSRSIAGELLPVPPVVGYSNDLVVGSRPALDCPDCRVHICLGLDHKPTTSYILHARERHVASTGKLRDDLRKSLQTVRQWSLDPAPD